MSVSNEISQHLALADEYADVAARRGRIQNYESAQIAATLAVAQATIAQTKALLLQNRMIANRS